jgi:hypothetical protein
VTCERSFFEIEILEIKKTGVGAKPASKSATISEPSVDAELSVPPANFVIDQTSGTFHWHPAAIFQPSAGKKVAESPMVKEARALPGA